MSLYPNETSLKRALAMLDEHSGISDRNKELVHEFIMKQEGLGVSERRLVKSTRILKSALSDIYPGFELESA